MAKKLVFVYVMIVLLAVLIVLVCFLLQFITTNVNIGETKEADIIKTTETVEWSIPAGFIKPDSIDVAGDAVLITKGCRQLTARTTVERAYGIFNGLYNRTEQRPDIYEGVAALLESYGIKMDYVLVYGFEDETFYSDAYFRSGNTILQLDMKPSDAMAVALRMNAVIYFNQTLFNEMSDNICQ
ncbi:MAG: bifunctional nuclease domain-containing protein [Candidatus Aenigmatarchaeota archaeon]